MATYQEMSLCIANRERFYSFKVHVQYDSGYSFDALFYRVILNNTNFDTAFTY